MTAKGKILVVDDNRAVLTALRLLLRSAGYEAECFSNPSLVDSASLAEGSAMLLDMNFRAKVNDGNEGLYWLGRFLAQAPTLPVVLMTAFAEVDLAVRGIKRGASDFIVKPWDNLKLLEIISQVSRGNRKNQAHAQEEELIVGCSSPLMRRIDEIVAKAAPTMANILITGENGTGKGVMARKIHGMSARGGARFVSVDLGSLPESLFESELFGHAKGAFTGAVADHKGRLESAAGGTVFLDEIGNLTLPLQAKLLAAIQDKRITRVGETTPVELDVRIIAATNKKLKEEVAAGRFREDLYYRLNTIAIEMPSLRQMRDDIMPMAHAFLRGFAAQYQRDVTRFTAEASELLLRCPWPGNIRQLKHTVESAVIMADDVEVGVEDLNLHVEDQQTEARGSTLAEIERVHIARTMARCGGNLSAVASELGITRQTLYNKIKRFGL